MNCLNAGTSRDGSDGNAPSDGLRSSSAGITRLCCVASISDVWTSLGRRSPVPDRR